MHKLNYIRYRIYVAIYLYGVNYVCMFRSWRHGSCWLLLRALKVINSDLNSFDRDLVAASDLRYEKIDYNQNILSCWVYFRLSTNILKMKCINIFIQTRHFRFTVHSEAKTNPNLPLSYQRQDIIEPSNLDDMSHFTYDSYDMSHLIWLWFWLVTFAMTCRRLVVGLYLLVDIQKL